jgi:hypothetical protein
MHRNRVALAVLATAGLIAAGCGSDDTEPKSDSQPEAAQVDDKAKPKPKSARAQMSDCIEGELGYDVTAADDDPDKLSLKSPNGKLQAVVVVHPDVGAARNAVQQTLEGGRNAVVFGRAEFIRHAVKDAEAGVFVNCVAAEYNRPSR